MRSGTYSPLITSNEKLMYKKANFFRKTQHLLAVVVIRSDYRILQKRTFRFRWRFASCTTTDRLTTLTTSLLGWLVTWADNIDGLSFLNLGVSKQTSTSYGITSVTSPIYQGIKSARFELRSSDPETNGGTRS